MKKPGDNLYSQAWKKMTTPQWPADHVKYNRLIDIIRKAIGEESWSP